MKNRFEKDRIPRYAVGYMKSQSSKSRRILCSGCDGNAEIARWLRDFRRSTDCPRSSSGRGVVTVQVVGWESGAPYETVVSEASARTQAGAAVARAIPRFGGRSRVCKRSCRSKSSVLQEERKGIRTFAKIRMQEKKAVWRCAVRGNFSGARPETWWLQIVRNADAPVLAMHEKLRTRQGMFGGDVQNTRTKQGEGVDSNRLVGRGGPGCERCVPNNQRARKSKAAATLEMLRAGRGTRNMVRTTVREIVCLEKGGSYPSFIIAAISGIKKFLFPACITLHLNLHIPIPIGRGKEPNTVPRHAGCRRLSFRKKGLDDGNSSKGTARLGTACRCSLPDSFCMSCMLCS